MGYFISVKEQITICLVRGIEIGEEVKSLGDRKEGDFPSCYLVEEKKKIKENF